MNAIEIVGLCSDTNGRSCEIHQICGESVILGDVLHLKRTVVTYKGQLKDAIKAVSIVDNAEKCIVGFVPHSLVDTVIKQNLYEQFIEVIELYDQSSNSFKRCKSHKNKGMALCNFIPAYNNISSMNR